MYILGNFLTEVMSFCMTLHRPGVPIALSLLECVAELLGPNTEVLSQVCWITRDHGMCIVPFLYSLIQRCQNCINIFVWLLHLGHYLTTVWQTLNSL